MTTNSKDITTFLEDKRIEHHSTRIRSLLSKLGHEELEDLLNIIKDSYDKGFEKGDASW